MIVMNHGAKSIKFLSCSGYNTMIMYSSIIIMMWHAYILGMEHHKV